MHTRTNKSPEVPRLTRQEVYCYSICHLTMCSACSNHIIHTQKEKLSIESDDLNHGRCYQSDLNTWEKIPINSMVGYFLSGHGRGAPSPRKAMVGLKSVKSTPTVARFDEIQLQKFLSKLDQGLSIKDGSCLQPVMACNTCQRWVTQKSQLCFCVPCPLVCNVYESIGNRRIFTPEKKK